MRYALRIWWIAASTAPSSLWRATPPGRGENSSLLGEVVLPDFVGIGGAVSCFGRLAEWSKAHVWSTCFRVFGTRVRIPDLPDFLKISRPSGALFKKRDNWFGRLAEWLKAHVSNTCIR